MCLFSSIEHSGMEQAVRKTEKLNETGEQLTVEVLKEVFELVCYW